MRLKVFSLFLSFALLLPNFVFAAPAGFTCNDVRTMKNNRNDPRWKSGGIKQLAARYSKIASCIAANGALKPNGTFWESMVQYHMRYMETYFAQDPAAAETFVKSVSKISRSFGGVVNTVCFDTRGRRVPCNKKRASVDEGAITSALEQKREETEEESNRREEEGWFSLVENLPPGEEGDKEEFSALTRIHSAIKQGRDISKFIAKLASNHKKISASFIVSAFMLFAESLPKNSADALNEIYKYVSGSYDEVIKFSAARAVALYSDDRLNRSTGEEIANSPAGKFWLNGAQRAKVAEVLAASVCGLDISKENEKLLYVAVVSDLARVYELGSGSDMFANAASILKCNGGGAGGTSYLAGTTAVLALGYTGEAAAGAAASAAGGVLLLIGGAVVLFGYALNDAYSPGYPTPVESLMRNFDLYTSAAEEPAPAVEEFPLNEQIIEHTLNVTSVAWSPDFVRYGAREATASNTATCRQQPQPDQDCGGIKLNDLRGRVSNQGDFVSRFKDYLRGNGIPYASSTTIRDLLRYNFRGTYRTILELLNNKCNQFENSKMPAGAGESGAFVKAYQVDGGGYMPEVEIGVDLKPNNISLKDVFSTEIIDKICKDKAFLDGTKDKLDLGNGRSIRNTTHERGGEGGHGRKHIHYEEQRNGFRCNHSIDFDDAGGSFLKQMRKVCRERGVAR